MVMTRNIKKQICKRLGCLGLVGFPLGLVCLLLLGSPAFAAPPKHAEELYELLQKDLPSMEVGSCRGDAPAIALRFPNGVSLWVTNERWVWLEDGLIYAGVVTQGAFEVRIVEPLEKFRQRFPIPCAWLAQQEG